VNADRPAPWERAVPLGCGLIVVGWALVIAVVAVLLVVR
jgi:hypothetical protein